MSKIKLSADRWRCVFGVEDDESTWTETIVRTLPKDGTLAFDLFGRHKEWGGVEKNQYRFAMAQAYYALRRRGDYTGNFDEFVDDLLDFEKVDDEPLDPTQTASTGD